jgi:alpha-galactosidase
MSIDYHKEKQVFHLKTKDTSYVFEVVKYGYLAHRYWGKAIRNYQASSPLVYMKRGFSPNPIQGDRNFSLDTLPQEYPVYGNTDFRTPAYQIQLQNGTTISDLRYHSHRIGKGKPQLEGLPMTYAENESEVDTLEIQLIDELLQLTVYLTYSVFETYNAITRSVRFVNNGGENISILRAASLNVDFADSDYELVHLSGSWANERNVMKRKLVMGNQSVDSKRGASSHQHNPFIALQRVGANEDHGDVYGFNLVYSGNFLANVEVDPFQTTRVSIGLNPFDFTWLLQPGEAFQTPEAVMVYSGNGLGEMSRTFHKFYRERLCRGTHRDRTRPILINNWEATYFNFNEDMLEGIARKGAELGIELFVLDDGWFGKRNDDKTSLGDWLVDKNKLPLGLSNLGKKITDLGMQFGLWFEPEMVSEESDLYRSHPDWCLHVPDRRRSTGRNQLVLDYSRKEVCDAVIGMVSDVLNSAQISYVKWDMNRHLTEVGSATLPPERQRETAHRYMLGLYRVMDEITSKFPHILFESCSGGGGRFDPGILYYMPQTWTSDNTDAVSRLKIQYGTSMVYPIISMGAHVSAVPNHQVGRVTSLQMRGNVAFSGNFGYELDLTKFTAEEEQIVKDQVSFYKEIRELVQFGDFYRLLNPFEGNEAAWMFVSADKSQAFVSYFKILAEPNAPLRTLRLKGIDSNAEYLIEHQEGDFGGDELMNVGILVPETLLMGDFQSALWRLYKK